MMTSESRGSRDIDHKELSRGEVRAAAAWSLLARFEHDQLANAAIWCDGELLARRVLPQLTGPTARIGSDRQGLGAPECLAVAVSCQGRHIGRV